MFTMFLMHKEIGNGSKNTILIHIKMKNTGIFVYFKSFADERNGPNKNVKSFLPWDVSNG